MVLMSEHGLQYLVTKGNERLMLADPPICETQLVGKPNLKAAKLPDGGRKKLLTADDPLVMDCLALFHRTALDTCNEDYQVTLVDAALSVIDGLRVMTHVTMVGPAGKETKHRPSCLFEVSTDHTDASFLQKLDRQPADAEETDPLPEEKAGLEATLELHVPLCDADEQDGVPETEAESFMFMMQNGMGELSKYKGYEYCVDCFRWSIPRASLSWAGQQNPWTCAPVFRYVSLKMVVRSSGTRRNVVHVGLLPLQPRP